MSRFWSELVHELTPYTPGEQPRLQNLVKLNTNENPYGPSPKVRAAIEAANTDDLRKYPDPNALELKQCIAEYYQLEVENVFVGNSSDEVLAHVFKGLLKQSLPILFPDITYSFYPVYCSLFQIEYREIPLRDDFTLAVQDYPERNGGIIFANPNAPTGLAVSQAEITALLRRNPDSVVVIDEAYVDFSEASAVKLIKEFPNLVVTQTLSKSRSLAGLRVGLALGDAALIEALERVKNSFHPYALDQLALAGAIAAFKDDDYFRETCVRVKHTRDQVSGQLRELGFDVIPSQANFVFVSHPEHQAGELFGGLREAGIVVRYFDKPRLDTFLRISIGTPDEMQRLVGVLRALVA
jgi:histidinol-phosphate aminotransferase